MKSALLALSLSLVSGITAAGPIEISGELMRWHKVTLTLDGPFAKEQGGEVNPFTDLQFDVRFTHASGAPSYLVPGYFAADGDAANTSATEGTKWRAHLSPDQTGDWTYEVLFKGTAFDGLKGSFTIAESNKPKDDLRTKGRLEYVGERYLKFAGDGSYFLKMGPDAPETALGYADIDGVGKGRSHSPIKTWSPHIADWKKGDPTWGEDKGKGLIGGLNYLASKGVNAYSLLTYNADGDGDAVWPFVSKYAKFNYDCSKLDQWGILFEHGQSLGLMLHVKLQETENDDNRLGHNKNQKTVEVRAALDGGDLGPERKLYLRELVARFGYLLALEWNIGEENTQSTEQVQAMIAYLRSVDPYPRNVVIHNFPNHEPVTFAPLLGDQSELSGVSIQTAWHLVHKKTLEWVDKSRDAGRPWVCANDEQNSAKMGVPPDPGYQGFDGVAGGSKRKDGKSERDYTLHDIRKNTLWGNLMAGGAGVMYYFGYDLPENDMAAEDWRSRDRSWDYCRIARAFFVDHAIPFWEMDPADALVGNTDNGNSTYCFAKQNAVYLVYAFEGGRQVELDLSAANGVFNVRWFNPRAGGGLAKSTVAKVTGGSRVLLGAPPSDPREDWLIVVSK